MTEPSTELDIPKYTGSADDGPVQDWFNLFEVHAAAASWSEREMIINFTDYISGEAFKFYLTHIFENDESWQKIREEMITRFKEYDEDLFIPHQRKAFQLTHHSYAKSSRSKRISQTRLQSKYSTSVPSYDSSKYTSRITTPTRDLHVAAEKVMPPYADRNVDHFAKRPDLRLDFSRANKSAFPMYLRHHNTSGITEQPESLDASCRTHGPHGIGRVTAFTHDELVNPHETKPDNKCSQKHHLFKVFSSAVPQRQKHSQSASCEEKCSAEASSVHQSKDRSDVNLVYNLTAYNENKTAGATSDDISTLQATTNNERFINTKDSSESNPPHYLAPETVALVGVVEACGGLAKNPGATRSMSHHKQVDETKKLQRQRILQHCKRRKKTSSKPLLRLKEHCEKAHRCVYIFHQRLKMRLRLKHLRHRYRKISKSHKSTPCTRQEHRQRPINLDQRSRKLLARPVYHPRRGIRCLQYWNCRFCKMFEPHLFFTRMPAVITLISTSKAFLCYPGRNHQPRPPELLR